MKKVIAIDGPSGAGKSTAAKRVAEELGFRYLDTGALYRATALGLIRRGIGENTSDAELYSALSQMRVTFEYGRALLNGEDVSEEIRSTDAGHYASVFSARRPVREYLLKVQQEAGQKADLVAEGRDMTTVVFPNAFKKFYLDASFEERARRRKAELNAKGLIPDADEIRREIIERDRRDSTRDIAPLKRSSDAHLINSTLKSKEEVVREMLEFIRNDAEK